MSVNRIGIIAGGGNVPLLLAEKLQSQNIEPYIIGVQPFADNTLKKYNFLPANVGQLGKALRWFRQKNISTLIFIGALRRPPLWSIWPDFTTFRFLLSCLFKKQGDDALLRSIRAFVESEGFTFKGIHHFMPEFLVTKGIIGRHRPDDTKDIELGFAASQKLGLEDKGQAVLVKDGQVIGYETKHGTNHLIKTKGTEGAILVKSCKPQQDKDLDMPTIGVRTVQLAAQKGVRGIVVQAGATLMVTPADTIKAANDAGIFIYGIEA